MTEHPQVRASNGADVDEKIRVLLELCWVRGWHTTHSCQGDPDGKQAYVIFARDSGGLEFCRAMIALGWSRTMEGYGPDRFALTLAPAFLTDETRAIVRFDHELLARATAVLDHATTPELAALVLERTKG